MSAVHFTACKERQGDKRINKLWPDPPIRVMPSDSLSAPLQFFSMQSSYWQCHKMRSTKFTKKRLLDKCCGISFKCLDVKKKEKAKYGTPCYKGVFERLGKKIIMVAAEQEIHIGCILYLYFIDYVCFLYKRATYLIIGSLLHEDKASFC